MKQIQLPEYLRSIGTDPCSVDLVPYDVLGEATARKTRDPKSDIARRHGLYFRPNYERGILIDALIGQGCQSYLEIGFGRGYSALSAARAQAERGLQIDVSVVDPALDQRALDAIVKSLPPAGALLSKIKFYKMTSAQFWSRLDPSDSECVWDICYIDGDHSYDATRADWEGASRHTRRFVLFDDYHLPTKQDPGIECARAIDEIGPRHERQLIITDRTMFPRDDGRRIEDVDYGQVLVTVAREVVL